MILKLTTFSISIIIVFFSGCLQTENSSSLDGEGPIGSIAFLQASEVFNNKCSQCHDYHTLTEQDFIDLSLVIPGDPEGSLIYYRNIGSSGPGGLKNMPSVGSITAGELTIIYDWVSAIP